MTGLTKPARAAAGTAIASAGRSASLRMAAAAAGVDDASTGRPALPAGAN